MHNQQRENKNVKNDKQKINMYIVRERGRNI